MTSPLDGRTVLLTGASSGLGRHLASVLAEAGADVVAAARREGPLTELAAADPRIRTYVSDVTDAASLPGLVDFALDHSGRIDVLVNNAGTSHQQPSEHTDLDAFRAVLDLNLTAAFALTQLVARPMLAAGSGSVVNIASIFGLVASAPIQQAAYVAAKGGLISLTRHLAVEWAERGVRVNAIAPGFFHSDLTEDLFSDDRGTRWLQRNTPLGRAAQMSELDGAVLLLAGDSGSYITGHTLVVDGGWTAR